VASIRLAKVSATPVLVAEEDPATTVSRLLRCRYASRIDKDRNTPRHIRQL